MNVYGVVFSKSERHVATSELLIDRSIDGLTVSEKGGAALGEIVDGDFRLLIIGTPVD